MISLKTILMEKSEEFVSISNLPVSAFVSRFKDIANDPKVQSVIRAGLTDGSPGDEKVSFTSKVIAARELFPTQKEIGKDESLISILNDKHNELDTFLNGIAEFKTPIVTLNGKYIIDGHHRWSQAYIANPNVKVPTYNMNSSIKPMDALKAVHIAIAADTGELPLSPAKGINLYSAKESDVSISVKNYLTEQARRLYEEHGHGKTKEEITAYLWKNIENMQQKNKPATGAPARTSMPQTGGSTGYDDLLKKGIINFRNPKTSDVKTESIKLKDLIR